MTDPLPSSQPAPERAPDGGIYLDNAATSWPKAEAVYRAVEHQMRHVGAGAGRGSYRQATAAASTIDRCRRRLADWIEADSADSIVFCHNGTAALNLAIQGLLSAGDHVVTTATEHNSVLRPLADLQARIGIRWECVPCDAHGQVAAERLLAAVRPDTKLVIVSHASNVTGAVQPIAEIGEIGEALRSSETLFLCDAAQTLGYLPLSVRQAAIDLLAAPGHKGLGGPLGTGLLFVGSRAAAAIRPTVQGGTGGQSEQLSMPHPLPDRLEAGNLNVPAIAGLLAAVEWLSGPEGQNANARLPRLAERLRRGLQQIEGLRLAMGAGGLPIASFTLPGMDPADLAAILDADFGIQVRAGLHCAAKIHDSLGTMPQGTVRISAGHHTRESDIDAALAAIGEIAACCHDPFLSP